MEAFRSCFDIPAERVYLNAAYLSIQPKAVTELGSNVLRQKMTPWEFVPQDFFTVCEELRKECAILMGCSPENIALVPSVSYGVETAVLNLPLRRGGKILMPQDDFPSDVYPWIEAAKRAGAIPTFVVPSPQESWTEAVLRSLDSSVDVVSVPNCDWSHGEKFDLLQISEKARKVGAKMVVDLSQSLGAVPVSMRSIQPDFAFSVGYKWQLGPYGVSYLYVSDAHLNGRPLENNWVNREKSEDFSSLTQYQDGFQAGARRFDSGQHSQFLLNPLALAGLQLLNHFQVPNLFEHINTLTNSLGDALHNLNFEVAPRARRLGHMIGAVPPRQIPATRIATALKERNINISARGPHLRISPHAYNNLDDLQRFITVLKDVTK